MSRHDAPRAELLPGEKIERHFHAEPYATVVLAGAYEEAGEAGRWCVRPGDVLLHGPFSAHRNRVPSCGARVLNLPLAGQALDSGALRVADPDLLARLAERDRHAAQLALRETCLAGPSPTNDLPDRLASALAAADASAVDEWARSQQVCRQTAFRWLREVYGVAPTRYRVEARARRAWRLIVTSDRSLADIALSVGFADQAHMCRDVRALTGRPPSAWRLGQLQPSFKTA